MPKITVKTPVIFPAEGVFEEESDDGSSDSGNNHGNEGQETGGDNGQDPGNGNIFSITPVMLLADSAMDPGQGTGPVKPDTGKTGKPGDDAAEPTFIHASDFVTAIAGEPEKEGGMGPAEAESTKAPEQAAVNGAAAEESSGIGQSWRPWLFAMIGVPAVMTGTGIFFAMKKKKKDERDGNSR